jgi:hypothetical protein
MSQSELWVSVPGVGNAALDDCRGVMRAFKAVPLIDNTGTHATFTQVSIMWVSDCDTVQCHDMKAGTV